MDVLIYIDVLEHYWPLLEGAGYQVGDFNAALPVIYVSKEGMGTYVDVGDTATLDGLLAPPAPVEPMNP